METKMKKIYTETELNFIRLNNSIVTVSGPADNIGDGDFSNMDLNPKNGNSTNPTTD